MCMRVLYLMLVAVAVMEILSGRNGQTTQNETTMFSTVLAYGKINLMSGADIRGTMTHICGFR